ncbi:MAG: N-acetyltransferase [Sphingopyxis sp.]|uniref:GNAT family N-acetyltransferase n=1 Tax=Sphingopyxis sp. TaxID=1908224 RepID=UPI001A2CF57A|nr:GNAT family N-acetyltransferase [Sphingopyxis sp.]MBJ7500427.1 N-acetyltransferase [Sphingopyxis sp.]
MAEVIHERDAHRYRLAIDGSDDAALAYYRIDDNGHRVLTHTEVPYEFSGRGLASELARAVFDDARESGAKLVLQCPFMAGWYARHPEYRDVVAG